MPTCAIKHRAAWFYAASGAPPSMVLKVRRIKVRGTYGRRDAKGSVPHAESTAESRGDKFLAQTERLGRRSRRRKAFKVGAFGRMQRLRLCSVKDRLATLRSDVIEVAEVARKSHMADALNVTAEFAAVTADIAHNAGDNYEHVFFLPKSEREQLTDVDLSMPGCPGLGAYNGTSAPYHLFPKHGHTYKILRGTP